MKVREAEVEDLGALQVLLEDYYKPLMTELGFTWDDDTFANFLSGQVGNEHGCLLVAEKDNELVGAASFVIVPSLFDNAQTIAHEVFLMAVPEVWGTSVVLRLERAIERWASENGVHLVSVAPLPWKDEGVAEMYELIGYKLLGFRLVKELSNGT